MAEVHEGSAPEASPVHEGQRASRIVLPGEDRGQKVVVPDVAKGQKPVDGSKAAPAMPPMKPASPGPLPQPQSQEKD
jgi:hypothetical protein